MSLRRPPIAGRLLLLHGSAEFRRAFARELGELGYDVRSVEDADAGMHALLQNDVDVLLLDCRLPPGGGLLLCRDLQAHPEISGIPRVLLLGDDGIESRIEGFECGADEVFHWRTDPREIDARLRRLLSRSRERKELDAEARRAQELLDGLSPAVFVVREDGMAIQTNRAVQSRLRIETGTVRTLGVPRVLNTLGLPHEAMDRVLRGDGILTDELNTLVDGEERVLQVSCQRLSDATDGSRIWAAYVDDITQQRNAEVLQADLHSMVEHDLRSPLAAIQGMLDLLREGGDALSREAFLGTVEEQLRDISVLLDDFLEISSLDAGFVRLELTQIDLPALIEEVCADLRILARPRNMEIRTEFDPEAPRRRLWGDRERLVQVLQTLVTQAIKTNRRGDPIELRVDLLDQTMLVSIRSRGPQLSSSVSAEPVPELKEERATDQQSGIVRRLVEAHGGRLGVRCDPDGGSTLWFTLPCRTRFAAEVPDESEQTVTV